MQTYGYARVSTQGQKADRQIDRLLELGIKRRYIYDDKVSGKDFKNRPAYERLKRKLKPGDLLYIISVDRLGRNYEEVQLEWKYLTHVLGIDICVVDMPLLDTRKPVDGLVGTFVCDIVLQTLSFTANFERDSIRQRQREGINSAKARGVKFGRPPKPLPENFNSFCKKWKDGEISASEAARFLNIPVSTFRYWAKR